MKLKIALILFAPLFSLYGCMYGYSIDSETTLIGNSYRPNNGPSYAIDVYFGEYRGSKKYEQIAFIRALGEEYSRTPELLEELKHKANSLGADAIIEIKTSDTQRERGSIFVNLLSIAAADDTTEREEDTYNAPVLSGIAVKYIEQKSNN